MADEETTQAVDEEPTEPTPDGEGTPQQPATPPASPAPESVDQLPDWAQKLVKDLRGENAKHRTAVKKAQTDAEQREAEALAEQGKYKELYEAETKKRLEAETLAKANELKLLKAQVAAKHKLPEAFASRLQGETQEELEADAEALVAAMPKTTPQTGTDAGAGTNGRPAPTPAKTDDEIREEAALMGVSFENLKKVYETRSR